MTSGRDDIYEWIGADRLRPADLPRALAVAGLERGEGEWRQFVRALLLWAGVVLVAAGVIFFFAYNWADMGRLAKLGLAGGLLAVATLAAVSLGPERAGGQGALAGCFLLTGSLLALFGQTYQTGADTFGLFAIWAALVLPWVLVSRMAPLWLLWIGLLNLAAVLYFQVRSWGMFGMVMSVWATIWVLVAINGTAQLIWEFGIARGVAWLPRWGARILGFLAGGAVTVAAAIRVLDSHEYGAWAWLVYLAWVGATYWAYRQRMVDVFMLSGLVLSGIVLVMVILTQSVLSHSDIGGFLFTGLALIGMSGAGGWWIRQVIKEQAL